MKKKIAVIIAIVVAAVILLTPMPVFYKDGGSKVFKSLTYTVYKYHKLPVVHIDEDGNPLNGDSGYRNGIRVEVFGIKIFDNYNDRYSENGEVNLKS